MDSEPDLFHFNFGGNSGKFFIGEDGETVYTIPQRKLKISFDKTLSAGNSGHILSWTIVDENGFTYTFGKHPTNTGLNGIEYNDTNSVCGDADTFTTPVTIAASWYLVEIKSPRGNAVTFEYDAYAYNFRNLGNQTEYYCNIEDQHGPNGSNPECKDRSVFCFTRSSLQAKKLKQINFQHGRLEFQTKDRFDICGEKALELIKVYDQGSLNPRKTFVFDYSYFLGIGKSFQPTSCSADQVGQQEAAFYRLKLNSVQEIGTGSDEKKPYLFYYDETNSMPPRYRDLSTNSADSYAQDHWGYYNGKLNNRDGGGLPTLIPTVFLENGGSSVIEYGGADRSSVEAFAKTYVLNAIKYPTGGETTFEYESNRVPYEPTSQNQELLIAVEKTFPVPPVRSTNQEPGKIFTSNPFTVSSEIQYSGSKGAMVTIDLWDGGNDYEEATASTEDCTTNDLVMERTILRADGTVAMNNQSLADGAEFFLPNGTYRVKLVRKSSTTCDSSNFVVNLRWTQYEKETLPEESDHILVGGLRIKKIIDYDGIDHAKDKVRTFHYSLFGNQSTSSGTLISYPSYGWGYYVEEYYKSNSPAPGGYNYVCNFLIRQSYTNIPLATTQGAFVGYKNVEVKFGAEAANGSTRYVFTSADEYPDGLNLITFPFPPPASQELRRGLMLGEEIFSNLNGKLFPVRQRKQQHDLFTGASSGLALEADGLKVGVNFKSLAPFPAEPFRNPFVTAIYQTKTDWIPLEWEETATFNALTGKKEFDERKEFEYNLNNLQVSKTTTHGSDGELIHEYFKYPLDYTNLPASPTGALLGIKMLQDQHIISPAIEKYTTRVYGGAEVVSGGQVSTYIQSPENSSLVVPEKIYSLELPAAPVPVSGANSFVPSAASGGGLSLDSRYVEKAKLVHDDKGNLLQWQRTDNIPTAYVWGYNQTLPIAEAVNAKSTQIFHTSFEENGNSAEGDARTGKYSASNGYAATVPLENGDYQLTYYQKLNGLWELQSSSITVTGGSYSLSLTGQVDEVRIFPPGARMSTYTYDPLQGLTTATDANHISTRYAYDELGRLKAIRDDKENILQKLEYHYTTSTND